MEIEKVRREAREILDRFAKELEKVSVDAEIGVDREYDRRKEGEEEDKEFREMFFKNAPEHDGDFILAEKKKWR